MGGVPDRPSPDEIAAWLGITDVDLLVQGALLAHELSRQLPYDKLTVFHTWALSRVAEMNEDELLDVLTTAAAENRPPAEVLVARLRP